MKKILSFLLISIMLLSTAICVVAADNENRETLVSLTLDETMESYTLIIPSTVTIDPATKSGTLGIELKDANLVWNDTITVYVTSANPDTEEYGAFLVNTEDSSKKIHYQLVSNFGEQYDSSSEFMVAYYDKTHDYSGGNALNPDIREYYSYGDVEITVDGQYPGSGTYTDTLTFTVSVSGE